MLSSVRKHINLSLFAKFAKSFAVSESYYQVISYNYYVISFNFSCKFNLLNPCEVQNE